MKFYGKIFYTVDKGHPDINKYTEWEENKVYTYEKTYTFDKLDGYTLDVIKSIILNSLFEYANGGFLTKKYIHIENIEVKRIFD